MNKKIQGVDCVKKLLKMLVVAVLLVFTLGAPSVLAENNHGKESLIALGDSITFGYNLNQKNNHPAKAAFPYLIGDDANLRVRNLGVAGWQTEDLLATLNTSKKYQKAIQHADYITLTIGGNDLVEILKEANVESGGNPQQFQQLIQQKLATSPAFDNLAASIQKIRFLSHAPIILYNIYNPFQVNDPLHHVVAPYLPQINTAFTGIAANFNDVTVVDAYSAFNNHQAEFVISQDIHPTNAGQEKLAEIGLEVLYYEYIAH